jgi:hypothetical protein
MKASVTLWLFLLVFSLSAQKPKQSDKIIDGSQIADNYERLALTNILLDSPNGKYFDILKQSFRRVPVDTKYDDNSIDNPFLSLAYTGSNSLSIIDALISNHCVNSVIAKWFSRKPDGSFGVELMHNRGLYNATDGDILEANASKRGLARIKDAGEQLINNSYIIVFMVNDLVDMNEHYDRQQKRSKTLIPRLRNGFVASITGYVFQLDFNDAVSSAFFENLWANKGDSDLAKKKDAFDNAQFPLKFVTFTNDSLESSQYNPGYSLSPRVQAEPSELMYILVQGAVQNCVKSLEGRLSQFKVTTKLYNTWPLRAKIGKKEGLKRDQRYFVYQMRQNKSGELIGKRKGVIRASKIAENGQIASGQSPASQFYQVGGWNLKKGMQLQQSNDIGGAFSIGYSEGGVPGLDIRVDINITQRLYQKLPPMCKLYIEGSLQPYSFKVNNGYNGTTTYTNFVRYGVGIGKEFCFLRNLRLQPFVGYGYEQITNKEDSKQYLRSTFVRPGFMFGINLKYNVQLYWQYSVYMMDYPITDQDEKEVIINGQKNWGNAWNRGGETNSFGIRFEL